MKQRGKPSVRLHDEKGRHYIHDFFNAAVSHWEFHVRAPFCHGWPVLKQKRWNEGYSVPIMHRVHSRYPAASVAWALKSKIRTKLSFLQVPQQEKLHTDCRKTSGIKL